jgi:hypothetical protein
MNDPRRLLPQQLRDQLDGLGVAWRAVPGGKHLKIIVAGRLVGIYPRGRVRDGPRSHKLRNVVRKLGKGPAL